MADVPPRPAHYPPGHDEVNPYKDTEVSTLPNWWRKNIEDFRKSGLRAYRPPRFSDGKIVPELIATLENEYQIELQIKSHNPHKGNDWEILVNGKEVVTVERYRTGQGYSVYDIDSTEVEDIIVRTKSFE